MPRPCLKPPPLRYEPEVEALPFAAYPRVLLSPHVHFPPTPTLTSTHATHSPRTYDRAPIAISPNSCALPERGGRMYTPISESWSLPQTTKGSYFHPLAYEACEPESSGASTAPLYFPPPLISDLSSESDESDGPVITPPDPTATIPPISIHFAHHAHESLSPLPFCPGQDKIDNALSFLPHPPSPDRKKEAVRRRRSPSSARPRPSRLGSYCDVKNDEPSLDGCLGGF